MNWKIIRKIFSPGFIVAVLVTHGGGCGGPHIVADSSTAFDRSSNEISVKKLWSRKMSGVITDLNMSKNGKAILVATAPDADIEGSAHHYMLSRFDTNGHLTWRKDMPSPVKAQAFSGDATLAVVSNYDDELLGIDAARGGKVIWTADGLCKPTVLNRTRQILCYHDDDEEPEVAFDLFDWRGKKVLSYPITDDILALRVSPDEMSTVFALTRGQVILMDADFHTVWQKKVGGEVLDVGVSLGTDSQVVVLYNDTETKLQKIAVLDHTGLVLAEGSPSNHLVEIKFGADGKSFYGYGNSSHGQYLEFFKLSGNVIEKGWLIGDPKYADYTSSISVTSDFVVMGFEDLGPTTRQSHLLAFDSSGKLKFNLPMVTEEGAYLYTHGITADAHLLIVGTDDATLSAYALGGP